MDFNLEKLKNEHTSTAIQSALEQSRTRSYLRDAVYGATDGIVTTFAVVAGAHGAGLSSRVAIILGAANLFGDGFSMAAGNYIGARTEGQRRERLIEEEKMHVRLVPEGEKEEIRQIFAQKGFTGKDLERVVEVITSDENRWVETMIREEYGLEDQPIAPLKAAFVTFIAFVLAGSLPLLSYVINIFAPNTIVVPFNWSVGLTAVTFFIVGAWKGKIVGQTPLVSGFETLAIGSMASAIAYLVGSLFA